MAKEIWITVDGMGFNASHYAAMTKDEAIKRMKDDSVSTDKVWAGRAWAAGRKAITEQTNVSEDDQEKAAQERLALVNKERGVTGAEQITDAPPPEAVK